MPNDATADFLARLRVEHGRADGLPAGLRPATLADAYDVQGAVVARLLAHYGGRPIGYKVACTSVDAQEALGTDAPLFGRLLSALSHRSPAGLRAEEFDMPEVEPEFAFSIREDVPARGTSWTKESVAEYVGDAMPAIEIVGHRFTDWSRFDAPTLVADNAVHLGWVHGTPTGAWRDLDLATHEVRLAADGTVERTGSGGNVLGHPLNAIAWLANELPRHGLRLEAGDWITTGIATTDTYLTATGEKTVADFGVLGTAELTFE